MTRKYILFVFLLAFFFIKCTKPYAPKAITNTGNYLVVEGTINTGNTSGDSTTILLSRTVALNSLSSANPELGATISIQDNQNQNYPLIAYGNGIYKSAALNLDNTRQYRLAINTKDGKSFLSDYSSPIVTPPIDSVGFSIVNNKQQSTGLQIYVNTHNPNNNTHYYRWDYSETWMFNAKYYSNYVSNGGKMVMRSGTQQVFQCWASGISTNINLGSSAKLVQDVIYQNPITFIPSTSEKIETRYSILVKQYALTANAYNYYSLLKQNTEQLGSIFDAQPSQLTGNIHCTSNPGLPVIGYITVGTVQQKRVYINNSQIPNNWQPNYPYDCLPDTAYIVDPKPPYTRQVDIYLIPLPSPFRATVAIVSPVDSIIGYQYVEAGCADCTLRGTTTKPNFWQ